MVYEILIGAAGASLTLLAFLLTSLEKIHRFSYKYIALNGTGSAIMIYYAWLVNGTVFIVTSTIWLSVELYYLSRKLRER